MQSDGRVVAEALVEYMDSLGLGRLAPVGAVMRGVDAHVFLFSDLFCSGEARGFIVALMLNCGLHNFVFGTQFFLLYQNVRC